MSRTQAVNEAMNLIGFEIAEAVNCADSGGGTWGHVAALVLEFLPDRTDLADAIWSG